VNENYKTIEQQLRTYSFEFLKVSFRVCEYGLEDMKLKEWFY